METPSLTDAVRRELLAHADVTEATHRFGGIAFYLGAYELGHLHGERLADLPFPPHIRDELIASGRVAADHVAGDSFWVSRRVEGPGDVAAIIELFRISYEHAAAEAPRAGSREERPEVAPEVESQPKARWRDVVARPFRPILRGRSGRR